MMRGWQPIAAVVFSAWMLTGCAAVSGTGNGGGQGAAINAFQAVPQLPATMKRVAVLPLAAASDSQANQSGCDNLEPVLRQEIDRKQAFDVVWVTAAQARAVGGADALHVARPLRADFLERVRRDWGCDGVIFCELTAYRPYAPLAVGWKLTLVDASSGDVIWAVDHAFDAGRRDVAQAARRYFMAEIEVARPLRDPEAILMSPRRFGQFAASSVLETMPSR